MNNELISVVIPVYKVENYLRRCVDSVIAQTYKDLEIILVDDGSPDQCGKICDAYSAADTRIHAYHKENGGLSDARNFGIGKASGKYITFIDSDDYIAPEYIEYLYDLLCSSHADCSVCCMVSVKSDTASFGRNEKLPSTFLMTGKECCKALQGKLYRVLVTAWGKLYLTEIVKRYLFPKGRKYEDEATTCKYYYYSKTVAVGNRQLYAYYQNPQGIMHSRGTEKNEDAIWVRKHRADFFRQNHEKELAGLALEQLYEYLIHDTAEYHGRCDAEILELLKDELLPKSLRLKITCFKQMPVLYRQVSLRILLFKRFVLKQIYHSSGSMKKTLG